MCIVLDVALNERHFTHVVRSSSIGYTGTSDETSLNMSLLHSSSSTAFTGVLVYSFGSFLSPGVCLVTANSDDKMHGRRLVRNINRIDERSQPCLCLYDIRQTVSMALFCDQCLRVILTDVMHAYKYSIVYEASAPVKDISFVSSPGPSFRGSLSSSSACWTLSAAAAAPSS